MEIIGNVRTEDIFYPFVEKKITSLLVIISNHVFKRHRLVTCAKRVGNRGKKKTNISLKRVTLASL